MYEMNFNPGSGLQPCWLFLVYNRCRGLQPPIGLRPRIRLPRQRLYALSAVAALQPLASFESSYHNLTSSLYLCRLRKSKTDVTDQLYKAARRFGKRKITGKEFWPG
jgi:hypothetical protein